MELSILKTELALTETTVNALIHTLTCERRTATRRRKNMLKAEIDQCWDNIKVLRGRIEQIKPGTFHPSMARN